MSLPSPAPKLSAPDGRAAAAPAPAARPVIPHLAACGFPSPAEDHYGACDELDLNQRCIANPVATYFVQADAGVSMVEFGIFPGDTLVVDRSITARNGDIVLALYDGGFLVKQWHVQGGRLQLRSGHPDHAPIQIGPEEEVEVWGVVTWSFRKQYRR